MGNAIEEMNSKRVKHLLSLEALPEICAFLDRPLTEVSGDLAFALDLRSHYLLAVLDGTGHGPGAGLDALMVASSIMGRCSFPRGLVWPNEVLQGLQVWKELQETWGEMAVMFLALVDREHREMHYCRGVSYFPPPWLNTNGRVYQLNGVNEAGAYCGRLSLGDQATLLVATDGIAHMSHVGDKTYWEARGKDLALGTDPSKIVREIEADALGCESRDDQLALAILL